MIGYTDITIRVPNEQLEDWRNALQTCQQEGIAVDKEDQRFIHPIDMVSHEEAQMLACEIVKIKQAKMFDTDCITDVVDTVKGIIDVGKTAIKALGKSTVRAGHL